MDFADVEGDVLCQLDLAPLAEVEEGGQIHDAGVGILGHGLGCGNGGAEGVEAALTEVLSRAIVHSTAFNTVGGEDPGGHQERFSGIDQPKLCDDTVKFMSVVLIADQLYDLISVETCPADEPAHMRRDYVGGVLISPELCAIDVSLGYTEDQAPQQ